LLEYLVVEQDILELTGKISLKLDPIQVCFKNTAVNHHKSAYHFKNFKLQY